MSEIRLLAAAALLLAVAVSPAMADDEKKLGWSDTAEFSLVITGGNAETQTLGFKNTAIRTWQRALFTLRAGGVRAESTSTLRTAVGTPTVFTVTETDVTTTTAEQYYLSGRYDREITERFFWFAGLGWDRNKPAGIQNRYQAFGGVGNIWVDRDDVKFRTDYGLTYTDQEDVVQIAGIDDTFIGARFSWVYLHKFGESTTYGNDFIVDLNIDETDDWRADMTNWLSVAMNKRLALKVSLQALYDNMPAFTAIPLFDTVGTPLGTVPFELDELDTIFTASLVVNF